MDIINSLKIAKALFSTNNPKKFKKVISDIYDMASKRYDANYGKELDHIERDMLPAEHPKALANIYRSMCVAEHKYPSDKGFAGKNMFLYAIYSVIHKQLNPKDVAHKFRGANFKVAVLGANQAILWLRS